MAIFGTGHSVIVSGSTQIDLEYSILDPTFMESEYIEHKSILTGKKSFANAKERAKFQVNVNLFKEDNPDTKLNSIFQMQHKTFDFYPHSGSDAIQDVYGDNVKFYLMDITPYYVTQDSTYDGVMLVLEAETYSYLSASGALGYGFQYGHHYGLGL